MTKEALREEILPLLESIKEHLRASEELGRRFEESERRKELLKSLLRR